MKSILLTIIYILLIMYDFIVYKIPYGNYLDETICIVFFLIFAVILFKTKKIDRRKIYLLICCSMIAAVGFISNYWYGYINNISIILRDTVGTFKFFLTFIAFDSLIECETYKTKKYIITATKILITIIFTFGIVSLFVNIGMGDSIRYGIRSYKFIFSYYNVLVFNEVIFIAVLLTEKKDNWIFYIMSFITLVLTLRTKALVVILIAIVFLLLGTKNLSKIIMKGQLIRKIKYLVPILIMTWLIIKKKVQEYISWGIYNSLRIGAVATSFEIAKDHFPLGSGFGSYGTNISYNNNSIIYSIYNQIDYARMMDPEHGFATMSDAFWPALIAQFGFFGIIFWILAFIQIIQIIIHKPDTNDENKTSCFFILIYIIFSTLSEAIFSNDTGVISAIILVIVLKFANEKKSKKLQHVTVKYTVGDLGTI